MRHRLAGVCCLVLAFAVLSSCGGSSGGGPNSPAPIPTSITVNSSSGSLVLGQPETFSATVTFNNGTTQILTGGTWGTDAPAIATVNAATGLVTPVARGDVTVFVDAQGLRGTKRVSVNASYSGTWMGTYLIAACTQTGEWAVEDVCGVINIGGAAPVRLTLTQTGTTVTGQTLLGALASASFTATVAADGSLAFTAVHTDGTFRISQAWQLSISATGQLAGSVVQTWTDSLAAGSMVITGTLQPVTRSGAAVVLEPQSESVGRSKADAVAALMRRR